MADKIFETTVFKQAEPICPAYFQEWPGERTGPLYWTARSRFEVAAGSGKFRLTIAADRHYEIFINGNFAVRSRNFFNGDKYMFCQEYSEQIAPLIKPGPNTVDVVVRTDPWKNKNHRCFMPVLMLEISGERPGGGGEFVAAATGSAWETSIIENWREFIKIGGCGTIAFERVTLRDISETCLSGFGRDSLVYARPYLPGRQFMPALYTWTDIPVKTTVHTPTETVYSGRATYASSGVELPYEAGVTHTAICRFEDEGGREINIYSTILYAQEFEFNGEPAGTPIPEDHPYGSWTYLTENFRCVTRPGVNTIKIKYRIAKAFPGNFKVASDSLAALYDPANWIDGTGAPLAVTVKELQPHEISTAVSIYGPHRRIPYADGSAKFGGADSRYVIIDMGGVVSGRLAFSAAFKNRGNTGAKLSVIYGMEFIGGVIDSNITGLRMTDDFILSGKNMRFENMDIRTFRYIGFLCDSPGDELVISDLKITESFFVDESDASFITGDPKIDALFRASVRNSTVCANELLVDNADREHSQWADGVLYMSLSGMYLFGRHFNVKGQKALGEFILSQEPDGQLPGYTPGKWFPRVPIQDHMVMVFVAMHHYYMHTGNIEFIESAYDTVCRAIDHWTRHSYDNGLVADLDTVFIDFRSHIYSYARQVPGLKTGALTAFNCYYHGALLIASKFASALGKNDDAARFSAMADTLRDSINVNMFDEAKGVYRDGINNYLAEQNYAQTVNSLSVLFEAAPVELRHGIMDRIFSTDPGFDVIPCQSFFVWQAASALFESGNGALAMKWFRDDYFPLIEKDPGTIWENFQIYSSRCQSNGATLVNLFYRYIAGVYPLEPGYAEIGICPLVADTGIDKMHAVVNTVRGRIEIDWKRTGADEIDYTIKLPDELRSSKVVDTLCSHPYGGGLKLKISIA